MTSWAIIWHNSKTTTMRLVNEKEHVWCYVRHIDWTTSIFNKTWLYYSMGLGDLSSQVLEDPELKGRCGDLCNESFVPHTNCVRSRFSVSYFCSPFGETPQRQLQINTELSEISALRLENHPAQEPNFLHDELIKFFWCHASRPSRDTSFLKIELPWRRAAGLLTLTRASPFAILTDRSWSNNPLFRRWMKLSQFGRSTKEQSE